MCFTLTHRTLQVSRNVLWKRATRFVVPEMVNLEDIIIIICIPRTILNIILISTDNEETVWIEYRELLRIVYDDDYYISEKTASEH